MDSRLCKVYKTYFLTYFLTITHYPLCFSKIDMFREDVSSLRGVQDQVSICSGQRSQRATIHLSQVSFPVSRGLRVHRYLSNELLPSPSIIRGQHNSCGPQAEASSDCHLQTCLLRLSLMWATLTHYFRAFSCVNQKSALKSKIRPCFC